MRAFRLAYDGRPFHGFQRQPDVPTVEGALFDALRALGVCDDEPTRYSAAGRTDAGVSAAAQTVAFDAPDWCSPAALDSELHDAIGAWAAADVGDGFHATRDARRREYVYHLHGPALDDGRAREAAARLSGTHDFHNLTPDDRGTERDVSIEPTRDGDYLVLTVAAGGFPRRLVRRLASLVRAIAAGDAPLEKIDRVLASEPLPGPEGIPTAPAYPLLLSDVAYGVDFAVDAAAAGGAREAFADRAVERHTRGRVADAIATRVRPG